MHSPLKYHGGKTYLAKRIVAMMPPHLHYVEPFAGGLSVLLARDGEGVSEVVNDLSGWLTDFWRVIACPVQFPAFARIVQATPVSENAWNDCVRVEDNIAQSAANFFIYCRQSMSGRMDCFSPLTRSRLRRGMNEQASAWLSAVADLQAVHDRLLRVVVLNRKAHLVVKQQDGPQTFFYLDPPYIHSTRATTGEYAHEMSDRAHAVLLAYLTPRKVDALLKRVEFEALSGEETYEDYRAGMREGLQGKFVLSGYLSPLYDLFAQRCGWHRIDVELPNNSASGDDKRRMIECLWFNF